MRRYNSCTSSVVPNVCGSPLRALTWRQSLQPLIDFIKQDAGWDAGVRDWRKFGHETPLKHFAYGTPARNVLRDQRRDY